MSHKPLLNFDEALALRQQIDALIEELGQAEYAAALALGEATAARQGNFPTEDEARWKEKIRAIGSARDSLRAGRLVVMDPALSRLTAGQLMHVRHYLAVGRNVIAHDAAIETHRPLEALNDDQEALHSRLL